MITAPPAGEALPSGNALAPAPGEAPPPAAVSDIPHEYEDPRAALDDMVAAYQQAEAYADNGHIRALVRAVPLPSGDEATPPQEPQSRIVAQCAVGMQRPDRFRIHVQRSQASGASLIYNAGALQGYATDLQGQFLVTSVDGPMDIATLYSDPLLSSRLELGPIQPICWPTVQTVLLLADDPLKTLLAGRPQLELLAPVAMGDLIHDRVLASGPAGALLFIIERDTKVLRRLRMPAGQLGEQAQNIEALYFDFEQATFEPSFGDNYFQPELPEGLESVDQLLPPGMQHLGETLGPWELTTPDGNQVTSEQFDDKVLLLDFWHTGCEYCQQMMPQINAVYEHFKDNDQVAVLAVSVDTDEVETETVEKVLRQWGGQMPFARTSNEYANQTFSLTGTPTTILLGKQGEVHDYILGGHPQAANALIAEIEQLLQGEDLAAMALRQFEMNRQEFQEFVRQSATEDFFVPRRMERTGPQDLPPAARTEPENINLTELWKNTDVVQPGNICVVSSGDGPPRILTISNGQGIATLEPDGTTSNVAALDLLPGSPPNMPPERISMLRTGTAEDGTRYFAAAAHGAIRVHLLNSDLEPILAFPEGAPEVSHPGITDVRFADLVGDGAPEMAVGYFDVTGVQCVDLQGERVWSNRLLINVLQVGVLASRETGGKNRLLCMNVAPEGGSLVEIGPDGEAIERIALENLSVDWMATADLEGDGKTEIAILSHNDAGRFGAIGIDLDGNALWEVPIESPGLHRTHVEPVTAGDINGDGIQEWILINGDGTIHFVSAQGERIDQFAYGSDVSGLAVTSWDDYPVLLVATPNDVTAYRVEMKNQTP